MVGNMKKIAVINQKGGVGKSTLAVNLSYALATLSINNCLVDLDPQAHSSEIYRNTTQPQHTIKDLFLDNTFGTQKAVEPAYLNDQLVDNLSVIHSSIHFAKVAEQISSRIHREKILHHHFNRLKKFDYQLIIMDCPPNLGSITVNAIYTADLILIPVTYDKGALDGMADLIQTVREVKETDYQNYFIVRNMLDVRNKQTNTYVDGELSAFSEHLMKTCIRRSEALNQSRIVGEPILMFDSKSNGTTDYLSLTEELLHHV